MIISWLVIPFMKICLAYPFFHSNLLKLTDSQQYNINFESELIEFITIQVKLPISKDLLNI